MIKKIKVDWSKPVSINGVPVELVAELPEKRFVVVNKAGDHTRPYMVDEYGYANNTLVCHNVREEIFGLVVFAENTTTPEIVWVKYDPKSRNVYAEYDKLRKKGLLVLSQAILAEKDDNGDIVNIKSWSL